MVISFQYFGMVVFLFVSSGTLFVYIDSFCRLFCDKHYTIVSRYIIRHTISEYVCNDLPPCWCLGFVVHYDIGIRLRCNIVVNFHTGWFVLVKDSICHDSYLPPVSWTPEKRHILSVATYTGIVLSFLKCVL